MANVDHHNLTGASAVHPAWFVQTTDPGAVGAHKGWVDTSSGPPYQLKKRDAANAAWETIGASAATLFSDAEGNPAAITDATTTDGTSAFAARRDHAHNAFDDAGGNAAAVAATASDGTIDFAARRDHVHALGIGTTRGDLVRFGAAGVPERVALGTNGQVLTSDGTDAVWAAASSSGSGGGGSGAFVPIQVIGPLLASQATLPFSVPQTGYRNIRVVLVARGTAAATSTNTYVQFNGDTGANYDYNGVTLGTTVAVDTESYGAASMRMGIVPASTATANRFATVEVAVPNYTAAFHKQVASRNSGSLASTATNLQWRNYVGTWRSTASITTLTLGLDSGSFDVGTYACLYGEMDTAGVLLTPASNLLYEKVLLATATTIDTGTLSQAYKDLRIEIHARGTTAATSTMVTMQANGDTGSNYESVRFFSSATTGATVEGPEAGSEVLEMAASTSATSAGDVAIVHIPGYSAAVLRKSAMSMASTTRSTTVSGNNFVYLMRWHWRNTAAITRLVFAPAAGSFEIGTSIRVYGEPVSAGAASVGTGTRLRISGNQSTATGTATLINWDTEDNDADNQHYTSSAALSSGTVAKAAASATLTGTSTVFLTDLSVGQVISVPGTADEKRVVTAIASDTSLTVNTAYVNTASGQTCTRVNSAVVFRQPGFYTLETNIYSAALSTGAVTLAYYLNNLTTSTSGTAIGQRDPTAINASAGYDLVVQRQFQQWDFVEVVWTQNAGTINVLADERTHFSVNARPTVIVAVPYVNIQDQKAQNTAAGTFTTGVDQTRTLNTIDSDTAGIAALASNQITLPGGTYRFAIHAPAYEVARHQAWLYNVTDSAVVKRGNSSYSAGTNGDVTHSVITGRMTLSGTKILEVRHRCGSTKTTNGFGVEGNFGTEIYTVVEFWKEG